LREQLGALGRNHGLGIQTLLSQSGNSFADHVIDSFFTGNPNSRRV
jgi:hypothetical protein